MDDYFYRECLRRSFLWTFHALRRRSYLPGAHVGLVSARLAWVALGDL